MWRRVCRTCSDRGVTAAGIDTAALWREHRDRLRSYIGKRIRERDAVDDILQEVFLKAHAGLSSVKAEGSVAAWLYRIAANAIVDHHRAQKARGALVELPDELPPPHRERDHVMELAYSLRPLIDAVPSPCREALLMADIDGLPQAEIARRLGLSVSGAKSRVQRGRAKLRALVLACCDVEVGPHGVVGYTPRTDGCACGQSPAELVRLFDALTVYQDTAP